VDESAHKKSTATSRAEISYREFTRSSKRPANFQQTSSINTCILNTFAKVCWTFAGSCKHPIGL